MLHSPCQLNLQIMTIWPALVCSGTDCNIQRAPGRRGWHLNTGHCKQTVHNPNSGELRSVQRVRMKGNMLGLIRAVPRRAMEERSQGSTKRIDIPPVEAPAGLKACTLSTLTRPRRSRARPHRQSSFTFVCVHHTRLQMNYHSVHKCPLDWPYHWSYPLESRHLLL